MLWGTRSAAAFAGVSGMSQAIPSISSAATSRKAPAASIAVSGLATSVNSSAIGAGPSRCRARAIPEVGIRPQDSSQPSQAARVRASRPATSW